MNEKDVFCDNGAKITAWNLIAGAVVLIATLAVTFLNEYQGAMMDQHAIENVIEALTEPAAEVVTNTAPESEAAR